MIDNNGLQIVIRGIIGTGKTYTALKLKETLYPDAILHDNVEESEIPLIPLKDGVHIYTIHIPKT